MFVHVYCISACLMHAELHVQWGPLYYCVFFCLFFCFGDANNNQPSNLQHIAQQRAAHFFIWARLLPHFLQAVLGLTWIMPKTTLSNELGHDAQTWNDCCYTNQKNWTLGSSMLRSSPGAPIVWKNSTLHIWLLWLCTICVPPFNLACSDSPTLLLLTKASNGSLLPAETLRLP